MNRSLAIFLSVVVLFAQHGAYLHALSHAVQDVAESARASNARTGRQNQQMPSGHESCEDCLSFAGAAAALVGSPHALLATFAQHASAAFHITYVSRRTTTAYHSRAPPLILV